MALPESGWWLLVALLALLGLATFAYAVRALDLLGSVGSFLLGLLVTLLGGLGWLLLMVAFTGLGFVATRIGHGRKQERRLAESPDGERGIRNVMGNGAAAGLAVLAGLLPGVPALAAKLAFATALAAVAADTLASELGVLSRRARSIRPPFPPVPVGSNGGVSLGGQAAAALGAALIAALAVPLTVLDLRLAWIPAVAGFLGCQLDSLLGATLEKDPARPGVRRPLGKQDVNFLASALPALVVLLAAGWL